MSSSKQVSSKQATRPSRPLAGPRATGVPKSEKNVTTLSGMVFRNFVTFYVLANRNPTGKKRRNTGGLCHFGLGQPLALGKILGPGRKRNLPTLGVPLWEKKFTTLSRMVFHNFFTFSVLADRTPAGGNCKILVF